ncbi:MAG: hypothetical protein M5U26_20100 [Planctomycetota bacterium]|nr:hypothetical protein [Planctomycetota bacterium]
MTYADGGNANLLALRRVAVALGPLLDQVVFIGGATIGLLITDQAAPPIRVAEDVDVVIQALTNADLQEFGEKLRKLGFREDPERSMCAYKYEELLLDVMPSNPVALQWRGQWTKAAMEHFDHHEVDKGLRVKIVRAPCLLALKLDALADRGNGGCTAP